MRRLLGDSRGATVVEFALVAPVFLTMVFGAMEGSRLAWTSQALKDAAFVGARCKSVDGAACDTDVKVKNKVIARAALSGFTIQSSAITVEASATCDGNANQRKVTIVHGFGSGLATWFPAMPTSINAYACFPALTAS